MANPVTRGFSKLAQFSGRDTRGEFWPYAGTVFALMMLFGAVAGGVVMVQIVEDMAPYAAASQLAAPNAAAVSYDPDLLEVVDAPPAVMPPMPDMEPFFQVQGVVAILAMSLLAAAVARRLHDRNLPGWVGLAPVPFLLFGIAGFAMMMRKISGSETPNFGLFGLLAINNLAYWVALITLIVLLALKGTPGANRYGAPSAASQEPRPVDDWSQPG
ncbi:DUF805 domain-containing protein [Brevundimonas sp. GCM10030266]|uniref:DUF805 domain-containing protein n=1 Tax=Brevundimonas sp. GCM10030266 TaxID=3273386 RepID=UPI0036189CFF